MAYNPNYRTPITDAMLNSPAMAANPGMPAMGNPVPPPMVPPGAPPMGAPPMGAPIAAAPRRGIIAAVAGPMPNRGKNLGKFLHPAKAKRPMGK